MKRPNIVGWHEPTETQAFDALNTDALKGLSTQESKNRQARFGANRLIPKKGKLPLLLFLSQFHDPSIYILLVSALITPRVKIVVACCLYAAILYSETQSSLTLWTPVLPSDVIYVLIGTEKLIIRRIMEQRLKTTTTRNVTRHSPSS
jgi:magnesium-transporting ATPase (P-type)